MVFYGKARKRRGPPKCTAVPPVDMVFWGIPGFPRKLKDEFIGECKKQGRSFRPLLANLIKAWLYDQAKGEQQ